MINVVLYQPEISPNTGNIIRTCFAMNAKLHIVKPIGFELHPKWLKRPAAGKLLSDIQHEVHASYKDFEKKYNDVDMFYITRYGQKSPSEANFTSSKDVWLMFGRESTGIPKEILKEKFDNCIRVPMSDETRSINLANTVAVLTYEVNRQLNFDGLSKVEVQKGKDWINE